MKVCAAPALLLLAPFLAAGQSAPGSPEFEAATVKPVPLGTEYGGMFGGPGTSSPGQIHYDATTLHAVVSRAYGVQRFQVIGPKWFDDERFDIVAKIPPGTTIPQFQLMLQKLLADRFHLELHKESRTTSAYEMTVAKSGVKMKPAPLAATPAVPSGDATRASTGGMSWNTAGDKTDVQGHGVTIRQILIWLSQETTRDIVDKTGLTEAYDFEMSWTHGSASASPAGSSDEANRAFETNTLDAAIEKYLGLKVTSRKVPVEMLVIDRLDRTPVEN